MSEPLKDFNKEIDHFIDIINDLNAQGILASTRKELKELWYRFLGKQNELLLQYRAFALQKQKILKEGNSQTELLVDLLNRRFKQEMDRMLSAGTEISNKLSELESIALLRKNEQLGLP